MISRKYRIDYKEKFIREKELKYKTENQEPKLDSL